MITLDNKNYDETKLSDEGKFVLQNIQAIDQEQNQIKIKFSHNEILLKHYLDILKPHLPEEIKEESEKAKEELIAEKA
tara:strand:+ start:285 stop:518 length:234 start_codon:yes stop_codon:yes gene_type:complete